MHRVPAVSVGIAAITAAWNGRYILNGHTNGSSTQSSFLVEAHSANVTPTVQHTHDDRLISNDLEIDIVSPMDRQPQAQANRIARNPTMTGRGDALQVTDKLGSEFRRRIDISVASDVIEYLVQVTPRPVGDN